MMKKLFRIIYLCQICIPIFNIVCSNVAGAVEDSVDEKLAFQLARTDTVIKSGDISPSIHKVIENQTYNESKKLLPSFSSGVLRGETLGCNTIKEQNVKRDVRLSTDKNNFFNNYEKSDILEEEDFFVVKKETFRVFLDSTTDQFVRSYITPPNTSRSSPILDADDWRICPKSHRRANSHQSSSRAEIFEEASWSLMSEHSFFTIFPYIEPKARLSSGFYVGIDPFLIMCCPTLNGPKFAYTLVKNHIYHDDYTKDMAAQQYVLFLNDILKEIIKNEIDISQNIYITINIFKDIYEGIIHPIILSLLQ